MIRRASSIQSCLLYLILLSTQTTKPIIAGNNDDAKKEESSKSGGLKKATGPPPFFLQDNSDSMCLGGETFKRCSIDTLFFVVGSPGKYQIHKRPIDEDGSVSSSSEEDGTCLSRKSCGEKDHEKLMTLKLAKCSHCGAKKWNILGDADSGYVLTEGEGDTKTCLTRDPNSDRAMTAPCDSTDVAYTPLQLQFASASDIKAMGSPAARLVGAAGDGDLKLIKTMLKDEGVDVNIRDWDELTALIPAASAGHLDVVKYLIKEGADVNAKDKDGITALMEASIMGHTKIVSHLLSSSATVDALTNSEVTALWLASGEGKVDVMKLLLQKGADPNNVRVDGITALMTSSVGGHTDGTKILLDSGADVTAVDRDGLTALHNAAENGTVPVLDLLVKAGKGTDGFVDQMSKTGFNALIIASAHGHPEAVQFLIQKAKADPNVVHENAVTCLMYAAASDHIETMKVLIDVGHVNIDALHSNGGSALLEAATGGSVKAVSYLIDAGAKFDLLDTDGVTPLMAVASQGNLDGLNKILESLGTIMDDAALKEHINLASLSGGTAVMFSAAGGHSNCTKVLIDSGADVNAIAQATGDYLEKLAKMIEEGTVDETDPHVDGVTAVHVAAQGGHLQDVKYLVEAGADVTVLDDEDRSPLLLAVKGNYGEVASILVEAGADPNTPYVDDNGENHNLLMDAIIVENDEFASLLIKAGADLYHQDDHKVTTLLQASHRGMKSIVTSLLQSYAAKTGDDKKPDWIDAPSDEGITPLIAAASEGHIEVVKSLLDAKANPDSKDKDQTNALMASAARGHWEAVEMLLAAGAKVNEQNVDGHTALMFAYNGKNQVESLWERYNQFAKEAKVEKERKAIESGDDSKKDEELDDGGTGPIIKEALANHTKLVDMLLKNGADEKIKDKEGHTAKDFDFHPNVDADVLDQQKKAQEKDSTRNEL